LQKACSWSLLVGRPMFSYSLVPIYAACELHGRCKSLHHMIYGIHNLLHEGIRQTTQPALGQ